MWVRVLRFSRDHCRSVEREDALLPLSSGLLGSFNREPGVGGTTLAPVVFCTVNDGWKARASDKREENRRTSLNKNPKSKKFSSCGNDEETYRQRRRAGNGNMRSGRAVLLVVTYNKPQHNAKAVKMRIYKCRKQTAKRSKYGRGGGGLQWDVRAQVAFLRPHRSEFHIER
jgi:hypothetical protein